MNEEIMTAGVPEETGWQISRERFADACTLVQEGHRIREGIGTLSEKSVHAALKYACEPYADSREVAVGGFVADIVGEYGIIEIQTRGFKGMHKKLAAFLPLCPVTVVWPCTETLWIRSFDPETGELRPRRRSPRHQCLADIFRELYGIRDLIGHENFHLKVVTLESEELRSLQKVRVGRGRYLKPEKIDRFPLRMMGELSIDRREDWQRFLSLQTPLPEVFSVHELSVSAGMSEDNARLLLKCFCALGLAEVRGKRGNAILYSFRMEGTI